MDKIVRLLLSTVVAALIIIGGVAVSAFLSPYVTGYGVAILFLLAVGLLGYIIYKSLA